ncbi:MAG TPA: DUF6496 domain-containing protein [Vicinamibacteria bacterium]|jgi:hypothetical protein
MTDLKRPSEKLPADVEAVAEAAAQALASIARPMAEVVRTFAGAVRGAGERAVRDDDPRRNEMAQKKSRSRKGGRQYGQAASDKVERAMHEMKRGKLKSGRSGKRVKSRKQAIAIGLSEARKRGAKVPRKRGSTRSSSRKK